MRYLFFDIECCDGKHICEFGYVVTDKNFEVLERECILMDPQYKFCLTGRRGGRDLPLSFSEEEYKNSPPFSTFYDRLKSLLEAKEQIIIGFSTKNDFRYLGVACDGCSRERFKFSYFDVQRMFAFLYGDGRRTSLEKAAEALGIPIDVTLHRSVDDAYLTMLLTKTMCVSRGMDIVALNKCAEEARRASRNHIEEVHSSIADVLAQKGINVDDFPSD